MKLLKIFWPILLIVFVWFVFSIPYFVQNKVPFPSNYQVNNYGPWNSYPGFAGPVKNNAMPDLISQIYPWKTITIDSLKQGILPLWNPYSFSGTTHLANYQSAVLSPFNLLFFILPFIDAWSILVLLQPLLAGIFMYLYLRSLKLRNISSSIGSISFMFCGFITSWMGYATLGYAILFLPLALFAIEKFYTTKKLSNLILLSVTLPLSFFSGHFQISLYFFIFVFLYLIYKLISEKNIKLFLYSFAYFIFGILLTAPQVLPSIEAYMQSIRSSIIQKVEIIPLGYIPTFFAPDFFGNPVTRNDWFGHYAEWNGFAGTITILLALYTFFSKRVKKVLFFIFTAILALLLCFDSPVIDLIQLLKIPVLSTSAASRVIVLFSFSIAVLSSFGIQFLLEDLKNKKTRQITYWLIGISFIFLAFWVVVLSSLFIPVDKIIIARQNLILPSVLLVSLIFFVISSGFLQRIKKFEKMYVLLPLILIVLVTFDLFRFVNKWQGFDPKDFVFPKVKVSEEFARISGYDRVFGNIGGEVISYYKLSGVEGYDAVYNHRYGQFIASGASGNLQDAARSVVLFPEQGLYARRYFNLLGIKYFVHKLSDNKAPWVFSFWNYPGEFDLRYDDGAYQVYENNKVLKRAYLVNNYKVEKDPQQILNTMFLEDSDLTKTVVLEENPNISLDMENGEAKIEKYLSNEITINTKADGKSLLFLSDSYYPGWKAFVDGKEVKIFRTDFTFRSVLVPSGEHMVKFVYDPLSFKLGLILSALGLILIFAGFFTKRFISSPRT